jgi:CheY-like chemotaxis protein
VNRSWKILVVDDDADSGQSFAMALERFGYRAQFITDPRGVIGTATRQRPHVVMLDIGMAGLDGFALAGLLKQAFPAIRVLALGGNSDEYRKRGRKAGFDAYVAKPVDPPILGNTLEALLAARGNGKR